MVQYSHPFTTELMPFWYVMSFILGTCVGSFLNVVIYRVPEGISLLTPPSHCPKCQKDIPWYLNIPLLSWLLLRGKCANCSCRIPARYFLVELLTGVMFLLVFAKVVFYHEPLPVLVVYFGLTMLVITTVFIDFEHQIIPDKTTYPAMALGLIAAAAFPIIWLTGSRWSALGQSALCLAVCGGLLALFTILGSKLFGRDALGWGDVKYIAAIGACLGGRAAYFTLLFGAVTGAIVGIILMVCKKKDFKGTISFGPFLAAGTYIWILFDQEIIKLYETFVENIRL
jgi:leader peptidase (prepilin peptidase)/N-methyltransferase